MRPLAGCDDNPPFSILAKIKELAGCDPLRGATRGIRVDKKRIKLAGCDPLRGATAFFKRFLSMHNVRIKKISLLASNNRSKNNLFRCESPGTGCLLPIRIPNQRFIALFKAVYYFFNFKFKKSTTREWNQDYSRRLCEIMNDGCKPACETNSRLYSTGE